MSSFFKSFFNPIFPEHKNEFFQKKFMHNNLSILCLSVFLTIEQFYYGLYIREPGTFIQEIHFFTAGIMLIYSIISIYIHFKKPVCISWLCKTYDISFGFYGFLIAIIRSLFIQNNIFSLPTIYIAVLYGFGVIFYFHPLKSFFIYAITSTILIVGLPVFQPSIIPTSYIQDTLSNNIIAWIASVINYRKYVKEFMAQKIITKNNQELQEKTLQIQKMNEQLKELSTIDGLTNIYNRRKLDEILAYEYNRVKRYGKAFSVILLDLDLFKSVNDTYGHNVGDQVLIETAEILKNNIRSSDLVGRWGGEEFLIICPNTDIHQALCVSEKLRIAIETHKFPVANKRTSSFGVSTYQKGDTIGTLISRADKGLYQAKKKGRNRVEVACLNF
ncbi:MAG: GGDEF domain-containing protein [Marinisporobacter sp.]|jgi:diguanylate cyclase (GGDEF)-like protein|nr:GGDEF domain-containing protein [Marinisporobacter sp.]